MRGPLGPPGVESRAVTSPASRAPLVVEATELRKTYGRGARAVEAVRGIDLTLAAGQCLGLLGPNGSGKSTTIKMTLGTLRPSGGRIETFGGPAGRRAARARTGYVPEEARRFGALTGRETVDLFARLQGMRGRAERRQRVDEALALVGLRTEAWRQRLSTYSRDMARRLAVAAAWVHQPDLLVLDEPTSGLDPFGTEEILALLDTHRARGGATLLSTHDRLTAEKSCDEAVVLVRGRVGAAGSMSALLASDDAPSLLPLMRAAGDGRDDG